MGFIDLRILFNSSCQVWTSSGLLLCSTQRQKRLPGLVWVDGATSLFENVRRSVAHAADPEGSLETAAVSIMVKMKMSCVKSETVTQSLQNGTFTSRSQLSSNGNSVLYSSSQFPACLPATAAGRLRSQKEVSTSLVRRKARTADGVA